MGTFYWKARHRWAAQVTMHDGKRSTATCHHDHSGPGRGACQEARDLLVELERLKAQHAPSNARTLTLGQYLERWLVDVKPNLAPATWRKHESIVRVHVLPALGSIRLPELSSGDVRRWLARSDGLGGQSRRHCRATLRRALADAYRDGIVSRNVGALAEAPKLDQRERPILTAEQCRVLIDGTAGYRLPPGIVGPVLPVDRLHALWVLAVTTGMREAEMLGLTWEDVDLNVTPTVTVRHTLQRVEGEWQLRPPKTDKSRRVIPLPPVTVAALHSHRQRQMAERMAAGAPGKDGLVFTTVRGLPIHGSNLLPELRAHLARLGLPKVGIHDLRHSCATVLFGMGVPLEVISDMLGHSTTRVTADLYRHRVPALALDAVARMEEAVGG